MHLLARIIPEREDANELRTIVCLQCNDGVLTMQGLTNDDARRVVADHFNRSDLTHDIAETLNAADVVFGSSDAHGFAAQFPDSLLVLRRAH